MKSSFNLLYEPWISCSDENNHQVLYGLQDILVNAETIRTISTPLPTVTAALHLLLLAYALTIFPLENEDAWEGLYKQGKFPEEPIQRYNQTWQGRFFLFDDEHPFFQDPRIGQREKDRKWLGNDQEPKAKGVSNLLIHLSSGDNATLFDHSLDREQKIYELSDIAQYLVMLQAYSLGGMTAASIGNDKYYKDAAFSRGILFLNRGENLFERLMLNLIVKEKDFFDQGKEDSPCWEMEDTFAVERRSPNGLRDLLTWQSRRILLIPLEQDERINVQKCFIAPGLGLVESFKNPFYRNVYKNQKGKISIQPMRFQVGRAIWRDSGAILESSNRSESTEAEQPITKIFFESLIKAEIIQKTTFRSSLFGMCTQPGQKKVYFYKHENFEAPAIYLKNRGLLSKLKQGLSWAEDGRSALFSATYQMASYKIDPTQDSEGGSQPNRDSVMPLYNHISSEPLYWSQLETHFYQFMNQLTDTDEACMVWQEAIRKAARASLANSAELVGDDPAGLKARAKAEITLEYKLKQIFNPA
jgi:CRISPR system Cascade subunit CasA